MKDTRTPVVISFWTLLFNVAAGLILMRLMGHSGLALALTLASVFNAVVLSMLLMRKVGGINIKGLFSVLPRMLPGLIVMAAVVAIILNQVNWLAPGAFWMRFGILGCAVVSGALAYGISLWICRVDEMRKAWEIVTTKLSR
jgi:putative peptidoglycan lipid II flippase